MRVGLLHPGEMGAVIGDVLVARGHDVFWAGEGRGAATRARAGGLTELPTVKAVASNSDLVLSVCPPHAALAVASDVAAAGFAGVFVDANAISPSTAREVGDVVTAASASFVDGGIVGGPPVAGASTRLYLAGESAPAVADLFVATPLQAIVLDGEPGVASALKVCYAAYTKGTTALLLAIRALAQTEGVDDALLAEWDISQPGLVARSEAGPRASARKAWRFAGEMDEIADALAATGLPDGFHRSAADLYRRLDGFKDAAAVPSLADLVRSARRDPATD
jgi:3-hydroxyisobutyrate dehydrogenase-like beta-hydroxyacid dehydrogenase